MTTFIKMYYDVELPSYQTRGCSGMDIKAFLPDTTITIRGGGGRALIPTGVKVEMAEYHEIQVRPRSGLALKHGVTVLNTPGTIDSHYEGEIGIILINHGTKPYYVQHGERIAQLVYAKVEVMYGVVVTDALRGEDGFGSTG